MDSLTIDELDEKFDRTYEKLEKNIKSVLSLLLKQILLESTVIDEWRNMKHVDVHVKRHLKQLNGYNIVFKKNNEDIMTSNSNPLYSIPGGDTALYNIECGRSNLLNAIDNMLNLVPDKLHSDLMEMQILPRKRIYLLYEKYLFNEDEDDCVKRFD